jgi:hypothetical protein
VRKCVKQDCGEIRNKSRNIYSDEFAACSPDGGYRPRLREETMRIFGIIAVGIALLIVGSIWYKARYPTYIYRYRMTVEVEVDGTVRSGASVIEVTLKKRPRITPESLSVVPFVKGDAVFVDLGGGRNVIALLASGPIANYIDNPVFLVPMLFGLPGGDLDLVKYSGLQGRRDLTAQLLPTFVTFSDLSEPKSARVVPSNEFERMFGLGVRFRGAWIEMTNEPVTRGIETKLSWLVRMVADGIGGQVLTRPGEFTVNVPYFVRR